MPAYCPYSYFLSCSPTSYWVFIPISPNWGNLLYHPCGYYARLISCSFRQIFISCQYQEPVIPVPHYHWNFTPLLFMWYISVSSSFIKESTLHGAGHQNMYMALLYLCSAIFIWGKAIGKTKKYSSFLTIMPADGYINKPFLILLKSFSQYNFFILPLHNISCVSSKG